MDESGVTVTGGCGTGYLLPTFPFRGSFNNNNSSLFGTLDTCDGNGSCLATGLVSNSAGSQNVNLLYTPAIDSTTIFQFGTPFSLSYGVDSFVGCSGTQANPGGPEIGDFTMTLASVRVVDASGNNIPGAQIHSQFFDIASAPQPASLPLTASALLTAGAVAWRKRRRSYRRFFCISSTKGWPAK